MGWTFLETPHTSLENRAHKLASIGLDVVLLRHSDDFINEERLPENLRFRTKELFDQQCSEGIAAFAASSAWVFVHFYTRDSMSNKPELFEDIPITHDLFIVQASNHMIHKRAVSALQY